MAAAWAKGVSFLHEGSLENLVERQCRILNMYCPSGACAGLCKGSINHVALQATIVNQLKAQLALPFADSFSAAASLSGVPLQADAASAGASQAAAAAASKAAVPAPEG